MKSATGVKSSGGKEHYGVAQDTRPFPGSLDHLTCHTLPFTLQVKDCLEMNRKRPDFSPACKEEIDAMIEARARDFRCDSGERGGDEIGESQILRALF